MSDCCNEIKASLGFIPSRLAYLLIEHFNTWELHIAANLSFVIATQPHLCCPY